MMGWLGILDGLPGLTAAPCPPRGRRVPSPARYERRLLTKLSAMELPSPPSSGITIQAHR